MMMPWPTYARLGLSVHNQVDAAAAPKMGNSLSTGMKYVAKVYKPDTKKHTSKMRTFAAHCFCCSSEPPSGSVLVSGPSGTPT